MNLRNLFQRREVTPPCGQTEPQPTSAKGGSYANNAQWVYGEGAALGIAAYYRGVDLRARTMSQLIIEYQKRDKLKGNYIADLYGPNGALNYILQVKPNPLMNATELLKQLEIARILKGNAYIYIERDLDGSIIAMWLCSSGTYNITNNTYDLNYNAPGGLVTVSAVDPTNVIHIRNTFTDASGMVGIPTHVYARNVLTVAATNDKLVLDNAAKGGKMKLLVQEDKQGSFGLGRAKKAELEKITRQLNDDIYEQDVVLMNNIANVTPISQSLQTQEISVMRNFSVREVSRMLGVPPILLMDDSNSSYKSPEAATQEFLQRTIQPNILELEDEFNSKMLGRFDFGARRIHVCERNLLRLDPKGTMEVAKLQLETGIKTINELRAEFDMPSVANGDDVYASTNLAIAGSDKLKGSTSAAQEGGEA